MGCQCRRCNATRDLDHIWSPGGGHNCVCTRCGATRAHDWDRCKCRRCNGTRDHSHEWTRSTEEGCACARCGATREHDWDRCRCRRCGRRMEAGVHEWVGCTCRWCGMTSPKAHHTLTAQCRCRSCGYDFHEYSCPNRCVCTKCGCKVYRPDEGACLICGYDSGTLPGDAW